MTLRYASLKELNECIERNMWLAGAGLWQMLCHDMDNATVTGQPHILTFRLWKHLKKLNQTSVTTTPPLSCENNVRKSWESVLRITNALSHHQEKWRATFSGSLAQWPTSETRHNGDSAFDHRYNSPIQAVTSTSHSWPECKQFRV